MNKTNNEIETQQQAQEKENGSGNEPTAFRRSSTILRTPPIRNIIESNKAVNEVLAVGQGNRENVTPSVGNDIIGGNTSAFYQLGEQIGNLVTMLEDGKRRSIHQAMRDTIGRITALYELAASERVTKQKECDRKENTSQTSPWFMIAMQAKRKLDSEKETSNSKRHFGVAQRSQGQTPRSRTPGDAKESAPLKGETTEWVLVSNKGKPKRTKPQPKASEPKNPKLKPKRSEALVISKTTRLIRKCSKR